MIPAETIRRAVTGRLIARNSLLNLSTGGLVLLLNVAFAPLMLRAFGMEIYGLLAVTWMVLGHLTWLDFGMSAASAKFAARELARSRPDEAAAWTWAAASAQLIAGLIGGAALWFAAPALAEVLRIDPARISLVVLALRLLAIALPFDLVSRALSGVLEATQSFGLINIISIGGTLWTFGAYALGIVRDGDFVIAVYGLLTLKVAQMFVVFWLAGTVLPPLRSLDLVRRSVFSVSRLKRLSGFGGWVSVSSAVGPLLLYGERWMIGLARGVAVLPLFTIPFQALASLSLLPASLASVLFPAFSGLRGPNRWATAESWFLHAHRFLAIALLPLLFAIFVWAPELLRIWIDADFARGAALPLRLLAVGFGIGLLAPISGAFLQGAGRPDLLAKLYIIELPLNLAMIWYLVRQHGVNGAALGYTVRAVLETLGLWLIIYRTFPLSALRAWRSLTGVMWAIPFFGVTGYILRNARFDDWGAIAATAGVLLIYIAAVGRFGLAVEERTIIRDLVGRSPSAS